DPEAILDLIYNEFLLREQLGEQPVIAEYARRFPVYAAALRAQAELHNAMQANATTVPPAPLPPQAAGPDPASSRPARAVKPVLVAGAGPLSLEKEIQILLRRRLLVIFALVTGAISFIAAQFFLVRIFAPSDRSLGDLHLQQMPPPFFLTRLISLGHGTTG